MRQFIRNKIQDGFENEWSRRLVVGGDGYMLRNLNYLPVQWTIHLQVYTMMCFSCATFWNKNKYFANDGFRNGEYLRLCKNGLLEEYKEQNKCNKAECFACNITTTRLLYILIRIYSNQCMSSMYILFILYICSSIIRLF